MDAARAPTNARPSPPQTPKSLIELQVSAYSASLAFDGAALLLLTNDGVHRFVDNEPPSHIELHLGPSVTVSDSSYLFWLEGAMHHAPKRGGMARALFSLAREPEYLAASRAEFAWVGHGEGSLHTLETLGEQKALTLYSSERRIDALTLIGSWAFFVERVGKGEWRMGRLALSGGSPTFGPLKRGRSPSMLATTDDELFYYDGSRLEVRRLSPDFQREEVLAEKFICSPIAVGTYVYCGHVEGLFELRPGAAPRKIAKATGAITRIVADKTRVAWISEVGSNGLGVQLLNTE